MQRSDTDPNKSPVQPPQPRDPTTSRSAPAAASSNTTCAIPWSRMLLARVLHGGRHGAVELATDGALQLRHGLHRGKPLSLLRVSRRDQTVTACNARRCRWASRSAQTNASLAELEPSNPATKALTVTHRPPPPHRAGYRRQLLRNADPSRALFRPTGDAGFAADRGSR